LYTIKWTGLQPTEAGWSPPSDARVDKGIGVRAVEGVAPPSTRFGAAGRGDLGDRRKSVSLRAVLPWHRGRNK
jgi:hypothetical protein